MIVFDTTALSTIWIPGATACSRRTKKPIKHAKERLDLLIELIAANDDVIIIPAPVLSEVLVKLPASKADELLKRIKTSPWFKVEAFDAAAAVELGTRTAQAMAAGDKREGLQADWTKVKFDRQIVSIALVVKATEIISDDADVAAIGDRWGVLVRSIDDLPLPAELIPPPLLASLEEEDESEQQDPQAAQSPAAQVRRSGDGYSKDEAGTKATEETEPGESEEEFDLSVELSVSEEEIAERATEAKPQKFGRKATPADTPSGDGDGSKSLVEATGIEPV